MSLTDHNGLAGMVVCLICAVRPQGRMVGNVTGDAKTRAWGRGMARCTRCWRLHRGRWAQYLSMVGPHAIGLRSARADVSPESWRGVAHTSHPASCGGGTGWACDPLWDRVLPGWSVLILLLPVPGYMKRDTSRAPVAGTIHMRYHWIWARIAA